MFIYTQKLKSSEMLSSVDWSVVTEVLKERDLLTLGLSYLLRSLRTAWTCSGGRYITSKRRSILTNHYGVTFQKRQNIGDAAARTSNIITKTWVIPFGLQVFNIIVTSHLIFSLKSCQSYKTLHKMRTTIRYKFEYGFFFYFELWLINAQLWN